MIKKPSDSDQVNLLLILILWILISGCETTDPGMSASLARPELATKNLVLVVIDGPRFVDTWGDPEKANIPFTAGELADEGVHYNYFYNSGPTYTSAGHTAITTGKYQWMSNDGSEYPFEPSIFQKYLEKSSLSPQHVQIVTSKSKLTVLADCSDPSWRGRYNPTVDAQNRTDRLTFEKSLSVLDTHHPRLMLIHFRGPDYYGHANQWEQYLESIRETDQFTYLIWEFLQSDPFYQGNTAIIVTNDHGRHSNGVRNGFVSHGDFCEGCIHINLFAAGPDFQAGGSISMRRELVDIAATVAYILDIELPGSSGEVMWELFR